MVSLRQQHRYGLSCGKTHAPPSTRTLIHVKLTDAAIRALEAHRSLQVPFSSCVRVRVLSVKVVKKDRSSSS